MGLSSATHRKPMMSVQNRCETSRFLTLRTIWLMQRGGSALLRVGEASLAMVPSMIVELRSPARLPGTARALYGTWPRIAPRPVELAAQRTGSRALLPGCQADRRAIVGTTPIRDSIR